MAVWCTCWAMAVCVCVCGAHGEVQPHNKSSCRKVVAFFPFDEENIKNLKIEISLKVAHRSAHSFTIAHTNMGMGLHILSAFLLLFSCVSHINWCSVFFFTYFTLTLGSLTALFCFSHFVFLSFEFVFYSVCVSGPWCRMPRNVLTRLCHGETDVWR